MVTGDEIISDTYNLKDVDDVVYEVDCKRVTKGAENIDIGANPSAEEAEEGLDEATKQVIDVVDGFRLNYLGDEASGSRAFTSKKEFQSQFKGMCKKDSRMESDIRRRLTIYELDRLPEESGREKERSGCGRGPDQGFPKGCAGILYQEDCAKFWRPGLLYW